MSVLLQIKFSKSPRIVTFLAPKIATERVLKVTATPPCKPQF